MIVLLSRVENAVAEAIRQHLCGSSVKARWCASELVVLVKFLGQETLPELKDFFPGSNVYSS